MEHDPLFTDDQIEALAQSLERDAKLHPLGPLAPAHPDPDFPAKRAAEAANVRDALR